MMLPSTIWSEPPEKLRPWPLPKITLPVIRGAVDLEVLLDAPVDVVVDPVVADDRVAGLGQIDAVLLVGRGSSPQSWMRLRSITTPSGAGASYQLATWTQVEVCSLVISLSRRTMPSA